MLAVRPSEPDARGAVVELLRVLVMLHAVAERVPVVDGWNAVLTTQRATRAVDLWRQQRHDDAARHVADLPPVSPRVDEAPAEPPPVARDDETEYARWRADVARERASSVA